MDMDSRWIKLFVLCIYLLSSLDICALQPVDRSGHAVPQCPAGSEVDRIARTMPSTVECDSDFPCSEQNQQCCLGTNLIAVCIPLPGVVGRQISGVTTEDRTGDVMVECPAMSEVDRIIPTLSSIIECSSNLPCIEEGQHCCQTTDEVEICIPIHTTADPEHSCPSRSDVDSIVSTLSRIVECDSDFPCLEEGQHCCQTTDEIGICIEMDISKRDEEEERAECPEASNVDRIVSTLSSVLECNSEFPCLEDGHQCCSRTDGVGVCVSLVAVVLECPMESDVDDIVSTMASVVECNAEFPCMEEGEHCCYTTDGVGVCLALMPPKEGTNGEDVAECPAESEVDRIATSLTSIIECSSEFPCIEEGQHCCATTDNVGICISLEDVEEKEREECPAESEVDRIASTMSSVLECSIELPCLEDRHCCQTTDGVGICISLEDFKEEDKEECPAESEVDRIVSTLSSVLECNTEFPCLEEGKHCCHRTDGVGVCISLGDFEEKDTEECPTESEVDRIASTMLSVLECSIELPCLEDRHCCQTTDGVGICISLDDFKEKDTGECPAESEVDRIVSTLSSVLECSDEFPCLEENKHCCHRTDGIGVCISLETTVLECPAESEVDSIVSTMSSVLECGSEFPCLEEDTHCCATTDGVKVCILLPTDGSTNGDETEAKTSTTTTTSTTSTTPSSTTTTQNKGGSTSTTTTTTTTGRTENMTRTTTTDTVIIVRTDNETDPEDRSEKGPDDDVIPGEDPEVQEPEVPERLQKVGNDLVNRRYLLPPHWRSITFVDRKLTLNSGKIMSFQFYFQDTREFLDGMFPGMRLQVWTPNITNQWAAPIEYTLKCEKIVEKEDVTKTANDKGTPVDDVNEVGRNGVLISLDVSDEPCMHVTSEDHIGFCSQDLVMPVPYDYGTDGQVDWMFNDNNTHPAVNETVLFDTLEAQPIPATFSVSVDIMYDENC